jgi:hypothetical protein
VKSYPYGENTVKIRDTVPGEQAISFALNEVLDTATVRAAFQLVGCNKRLAKELQGHLFFALETWQSDQDHTLGVKEKAGLYDRELRRQDKANRTALQAVHDLLE